MGGQTLWCRLLNLRPMSRMSGHRCQGRWVQIIGASAGNSSSLEAVAEQRFQIPESASFCGQNSADFFQSWKVPFSKTPVSVLSNQHPRAPQSWAAAAMGCCCQWWLLHGLQCESQNERLTCLSECCLGTCSGGNLKAKFSSV